MLLAVLGQPAPAASIVCSRMQVITSDDLSSARVAGAVGGDERQWMLGGSISRRLRHSLERVKWRCSRGAGGGKDGAQPFEPRRIGTALENVQALACA
jgi:hypothetical protein